MLRNWVNLLLMAAAAALLLVASGVPAASAMAHGGAAMAMQGSCGAMDMGSDTDTLPSLKAHCAVGCMMSPGASEESGKAAVPAALPPCCGQATALRSAPLTLDPPPPRPRSPSQTQIIEWRLK